MVSLTLSGGGSIKMFVMTAFNLHITPSDYNFKHNWKITMLSKYCLATKPSAYDSFHVLIISFTDVQRAALHTTPIFILQSSKLISCDNEHIQIN